MQFQDFSKLHENRDFELFVLVMLNHEKKLFYSLNEISPIHSVNYT